MAINTPVRISSSTHHAIRTPSSLVGASPPAKRLP
jgi:hypothetical protein